MPTSRRPVSSRHAPGVHPLPLDPGRDRPRQTRARFRRLRVLTIGLTMLLAAAGSLAIGSCCLSEPDATASGLLLLLSVPALQLGTGIITASSVRWGHRLSVATLLVAIGAGSQWLMNASTRPLDRSLPLVAILVVPSSAILLCCRHLHRVRRSLILKSIF